MFLQYLLWVTTRSVFLSLKHCQQIKRSHRSLKFHVCKILNRKLRPSQFLKTNYRYFLCEVIIDLFRFAEIITFVPSGGHWTRGWIISINKRNSTHVKVYVLWTNSSKEVRGGAFGLDKVALKHGSFTLINCCLLIIRHDLAIKVIVWKWNVQKHSTNFFTSRQTHKIIFIAIFSK